MHFLFFGMGYSSRVAARALRENWDDDLSIAGTMRTSDQAKALSLEEVDPHIFDGESPGPTIPDLMPSLTHLVHSIAPDAAGDAVFTHHLNDLDRADNLQWMCYYSTVGVYGNADGAWISEKAETRPKNQRSQYRLQAERAWRDYAAARGLPLMILRLAGIYGPGRSAFDKLRAGTARRIVKPGQVFNRIHVVDIARVTALGAKARLNGTFNLADDMPAPPQDVVGFAATLSGMALPPETLFETAEMSEMARSFYGDNKRVSNAAIKNALGLELRYPTYREGLTSIYGAL